METKICKFCKKEFEPQLLPSGRYSKSNFCCKECEQNYNKQFLITKTRVCKYCNKTFQVPRTNNGKSFSTTKYCSNECYVNALKEQNKRTCIVCGKTFLPEYLEKSKRFSKTNFCSKDCEKEYYDKNRQSKIKCSYCGKEFLRPRSTNGKGFQNIKYCSDTCRQSAESSKITKRYCINCNKELPILYTSSGHISKTKFCNSACEKEYYDKTKLKEKTCLYCGKRFKPLRLDNGKLSQSNYCSDDCWMKGTNKNFKSTCQEKYGVDYPVLLKEVKEAQGNIISKLNTRFCKELSKHNINYSLEYIINDLSYDIAIQDKNILIEINPTYTHTVLGNHYNNFKYNEKFEQYHINKTNIALNNGYRCINVWDWDNWDKIISLLTPKQKLYARKLQLKEITKQEANVFLNMYHLQESCYGNEINLGLFNNDNKLVQVMTFGKPRYNKNYQYELLRLCSHNDYIIIGGAEKLFKYFVTKYNPESIISYCDISKFTGDIYTKLGFTLKEQTKPAKIWSKNEKHITDNLLRQYGFDKLVGLKLNPPQIYGKGTSNEELMTKYGWLPVYDCGQKVFMYGQQKIS